MDSGHGQWSKSSELSALTGARSSFGRWTITAALMLLIIAALIILWFFFFDVAETTDQRISRTGIVRIGYAIEAPYAFLDGTGRVTGESPEVARSVWNDLGVHRIEWVRTDFGSLIPKLQAGRFDQIACGLFIRPERRKQVAFSLPTLAIVPALLVRKGNPYKLHSLEDIAAGREIRLAVIAGAVEKEAAAKAGIPSGRIQEYPNIETVLLDMRQGAVDALSLSSPTIQRLADLNEDMDRAMPFHAPKASAEFSAFAFRLGDRRLREKFDQVLRDYLGSEEHLMLLARFGLTSRDIPQFRTIPSREEGK